MDIINKKYKTFLIENLSKNIKIKALIAILILIFFALSDIFYLKNTFSFYLRLVVIFPLISLLFIKNPFTVFNIYNVILFLAELMMYSKIILHYNEANFNLSIEGLIIVIFIVSLEARISGYKAILLFFAPFVLFNFAFLMLIPTADFYTTNLNIFPLVIIGYFANMYLNKLLFKEFKTSCLLAKEKQIVEQQNEELKVLNETKNKFFSIISHDLKNPFNIILGFSELLKENHSDSLNEKEKYLIKEIFNNSRIVYEMLDNLLKWSSVQIKGLQLKMKIININQLIDKIIATQNIVAKNKNIQLINNTKIDNIEFVSDEFSLQLILNNLISNAIKFSQAESKIEIYARKCNNNLFLLIRDYGVGMTNEQIESLFALGKNKSTQGTNKEKGTGLGLILVSDVIKQLGGKIKVKSQVEKGTVFIIVLNS